MAHDTFVSLQPVGMTSVRSCVVPGAKGSSDCEPLPLIVQLLWPDRDGAELLNWKAVPSLGLACLTMVKNPLGVVMTQSTGLEFGSCEL